ncbi:MAG: acyl-CoA dehydrogenase family protein, partial [Oricola sp.]|nr:acyl-CoA dehydrogenase family protein [Oricola sp.]
MSTDNTTRVDDEDIGAAVAETAAAFAAKHIAPFAMDWEERLHFPVAELKEAAGLGMAAIYCREEFGGSGLSRLDGVRIFTELSAADPTTAAFLSIHNMVAWMVDTYGTDAQRAQWVPALARMDLVASYCLTEP